MLGSVNIPGGISLVSTLPQVFGKARCGFKTLPNTPIRFGATVLDTGTRYFRELGTTSIPGPDFGKFGTTSIPVTDNSARTYRGYLHSTSGSVRPQQPTEHSGMVRYKLDTGNRQFVKFGTPAENTSGTRYGYRYTGYPTLPNTTFNIYLQLFIGPNRIVLGRSEIRHSTDNGIEGRYESEYRKVCCALG